MSNRTVKSIAGALVAATATFCVYAAPATEKVKIAYTGAMSDVGFFVADAKGLFAAEGIDVEFIQFDGGPRMIAPIATGEIDVGASINSASLFNALDRDIAIRIVADKGRNVKGMSFQGLMVRKALIETGAVRSIADLKGRKFANVGPGITDQATIDEALRAVGLNIGAMEVVYLGFPAQLAAYQNGALDASIMPEPFRTNAIRSGVASELAPVFDLRSDNQIGVVIYGDAFIKRRPQVAHAFMKAYIRGVRYYMDQVLDGKIAGPNADDIIDILAKYSAVKDKTVLRAVVPVAIEPNGQMNRASLEKDLQFFKAQALVKSGIGVEQVIDSSWVDAAVEELGPYRRK
jgi:NitT/TauT family transport system substrate-binding protein